MDSYSNSDSEINEQSGSITCIKATVWASFLFYLVGGIVLVAINHFVSILISIPVFIRCFIEILIIIGISCKNYILYKSGVILCFLINIVKSIFIFAFFSVYDDESEHSLEALALFFIIFTAIQIYIEFFIYICYIKKVKNYCSSNPAGVIYPVQTSNDQDIDGLYNPIRNIDNQVIDTPIISPAINTDNQEIIYKNTSSEQNADKQGMSYIIPPPVKNADTNKYAIN